MENDDLIDIKQRLATLEQKMNSQCEKCEYITKDVTNKIQETKEILESMRTLNVSVTKLTEQIKYNSNELADMKDKLACVMNKPGERWNLFTTTLITLLTSSVVTAIINFIAK